MPRLILLFATLFCLSSPVGAQELTGFGSISFRAPKDAVLKELESLGVTAEWESDETLVYKYPVDWGPGVFTVTQIFYNARTSSFTVDFKTDGKRSRAACATNSMYFAAMIQNKYGVQPVYRRIEEVWPEEIIDSDLVHKSDIYVFGFDKGGSITMIESQIGDSAECSVRLFYNPSASSDAPF